MNLKKNNEENKMSEVTSRPAMELLLEKGQQLARLDIQHVDPAKGVPFAVVPQGMVIENLSRFIPDHPDRKRMKVALGSVESFIAYVNEHKSEHTRIFASMTAAPYTMTAAIDYHETGPGGLPEYVTHTVVLTLQETDEWKRWFGHNEKPFDQVDFAFFIENNLIDIVEPESAVLMEVALSLQANTEGRFTSASRLQDGATHFEFKADINARAGRDGSLEIPEKFKLSIPVFRGVPEKEIEAHFRYRLNRNDGDLKLFYQLIRPQVLIDTMVKTAVAQVKDGVELPIFEGTYTNM